MSRIRTTSLAVALLATAALGLGAAACSSPSTPSDTTTPTAARSAAEALTLTDGWAKAGSGMTGLFGTLANSTDEPITVTSAASDAASRTELHTMAKQPDGSMKMVQKEGGFVVPARGTVALAPGGDHVMLIGLSDELRNGDTVEIRLTASDGTTFEWSVPVRSFAGAEEEYLPGAASTTADH